MRVLVCLLSFALIGACYGQDNCRGNTTGCGECSSGWDFNNITSVAYIQADGKCQISFSWHFECQEGGVDPWLDFKCEYFESGESCNSQREVTCASCISYTITDIDVLYDPHVEYYDSCRNYFVMPLTQPCVNSIEEKRENSLISTPSPECQGCPSSWDYNNITSTAYKQTNGKCKMVFTWNFEYRLEDSNPWLYFLCEYFESGESCNSEHEAICGSSQKYIITNINVLHDPRVYFYDSCGNYFELELTQPCVNAVESTCKFP